MLDKDLDHFYAVIMAGGSGTRLWPLSRHDHPKQMLDLLGEGTLFQLSIDRLKGLFPLNRVLIVTGKEQVDAYLKEVPELSSQNFLLEPEPRGTAAVVAWAAKILYDLDPDSVMAVLTADHIIKNVNAFQEVLKAAFSFSQIGKLVTLGIKPTSARTGYGYIQFGSKISDFQGHSGFKVLQFKEKPDLQKAEEFIKSGDHAWNSGMFVWKTATILEEFQKWMPDLLETVTRFCSALNSKDDSARKSIWTSITPQTIDYGIMERSQDVGMIQASDLGWNDVGSWESLFEVFQADGNGNILIKRNNEIINTSGSVITTGSLLASYVPDKLTATFGIKNLIVIDTEKALLICSRENAQNVKEMVDYLKKNNLMKYL